MRYIRWTLLIIVVLALITTGVIYYSTQHQKPVQSAVITPQVQDIPLNADKILELVNIERAKVNVAPLVMDTGLVATAQSRADDMAKRDYFGHRDPVTNENMVNILNEQKQCVYASENISEMLEPIGDNNNDTVQGWVGSKPHYDAMIDSRYTLTGIAISKNKIVQHFCQTN